MIMKKLKTLSFMFMAAFAVTMLPSCSDDDDTTDGTDPTPPAVDEDVFQLSSDGEQKPVTIPIAEPWEATSSADWLQLSQMGGKGGESVQVIAAKNLTGRERTGYIRFGEAPASRASADSTQIVVRQPANEEQDAPGVVLTAADYKDGGIYVDIYNGRESTSTMQQLASESAAFTFTDPNATVPTKEPIVYIKKGQTYTAKPYVVLDGSGVAEGKFSIAGEPSVNTLRVKQNIVFSDLGQLNNGGSAGLHFTDGDIIYYGGGIESSTSLGYQETTPSYEFRAYETSTGTEHRYADIPCQGAGACVDGAPVIAGDGGIYRLSGTSWTPIAQRSGEVVAAAADGNKLYVVTGSTIEAYTIGKDDNGNITATLDGTNEHGEYFGEVAVTHDSDGTTWLMDDLMHTAYAVKGGSLEPTVCAKSDSLSTNFSFIGVADGCIYAFDGSAVTRYTVGDGTPEPLRMLGTFDWYGATECVGGRLYNFGGTTTFRGTSTASRGLRRFSPADYAPISVAIMPE